MSDTVTTQFDRKPWNFEKRLLCASNAPRKTVRESSFITDLEDKYRIYGTRMFLSDNQRRYLQGLAIRGGWRPSMDQTEAYYPFKEVAHV